METEAISILARRGHRVVLFTVGLVVATLAFGGRAEAKARARTHAIAPSTGSAHRLDTVTKVRKRTVEGKVWTEARVQVIISDDDRIVALVTSEARVHDRSSKRARKIAVARARRQAVRQANEVARKMARR